MKARRAGAILPFRRQSAAANLPPPLWNGSSVVGCGWLREKRPFGLQCAFDVLVCNYKQNLAVAWWYLLGSELMKERIYTDRVNRYTTVDLDKARELNARFYADYMNELLTFVDSIDLQRDWCIDCDAMIKLVEVLP